MKLTLDTALLKRYANHYFDLHPRAKKPPIKRPFHPSINQWMIKKRPAMNALKQKWKDFCVWWVRDLGLTDKNLTDVQMTFITYKGTRHRCDPDNTVPKFILDGFTKAGLIKDDDGRHLKSLTLITRYEPDRKSTRLNSSH